MKRDGCGPAVGEQLESADFVDDGFFGQQIAKNISKFVGDDEGSRDGFETVRLFQDLRFNAFPRQQGGGKQASRRSANDRYRRIFLSPDCPWII